MPEATLTPKDAERFWGHVDCGQPDECWQWTRAFTGKCAKDAPGYGQFRWRHLSLRAHRVAWVLGNGLTDYPPPETVIMHKCDNPACCNPRHLVAGTHLENMRDCRAKGRSQALQATHCPKGHAYDADNTAYRPNGWRRCKKCCGYTGGLRGTPRISDERRAAIFASIAAGMRGRKLAKAHGISSATGWKLQQEAQATPSLSPSNHGA